MEEQQLFGSDSSSDDSPQHSPAQNEEEALFGEQSSSEDEKMADSDEQEEQGAESENENQEEEEEQTQDEAGNTQDSSDGEEHQSGSGAGSPASQASGSGEERQVTSDSEVEQNHKNEEVNDGSSEEGNATPIHTQSTDDENEENNNDNAESEKQPGNDLFGDADDISSSEDEKEKQINDDDGDGDRIAPRNFVSDDDEEEMEANLPEDVQEKEVLETRIEVEIPKITTDLGSNIHFVRFPNFISVDARPFDSSVYEDEIEEDELLDEEGRTRLKLKVENTIRWRKYTDENNVELMESNARMVKWSDGSMSMYLGSEIFDVHQMSLQGDHNHLFIRQGTGLQGQAVFKTKLTFRPHSTKSATHKKMTNRLAMRHNHNQQKVRVLPIAGLDPESRKAALMKEEEDQLKAHMRREAQKRRMQEKSQARGLSSHYLEDRYHDEGTTNDDEEDISVSAIKNRFKSGGLGGRRDRVNIYSSESDSEGEKRLINAKMLSSDEEEIHKGPKRKTDDSGEARKKTYNVSDSEDDDVTSNHDDVTADDDVTTSHDDATEDNTTQQDSSDDSS